MGNATEETVRSLAPSPHAKRFTLTDIAGASGGFVDLAAVVGAPQQLPREIHVHGPGTLGIRNSFSGTDETIDVDDGEPLPLIPKRLNASGTTGFTSLTVFW